MATKTTVFNSFSPNQQVIVQAGRPEARDVNNRVVAQFIPEIRADFSHNQLETDDSKVIDYLKNHDDFNSPRGWWLEGSRLTSPSRPGPTRARQSPVPQPEATSTSCAPCWTRSARPTTART
jgi:hypothetical protein